MTRSLDSPRRLTKRRRRLVFSAGISATLLLAATHALGWFDHRQVGAASGLAGLDPTIAARARRPVSLPSAPRIDWLGHAGVILRWPDLTLLLDPNLSRTCRVARRPWLLDPAAQDALFDHHVDAVLISHSHYDHLDLPTLRSFGDHLQQVIVPRGAARYLQATRLASQGRVDELATGAEPIFIRGSGQPPIEVHAVPAAHNGSRNHPFHSSVQANGYVIRRGDFTLYYAGDTGRSAPFRQIATRFHPDVALLPIGAFSPRWPLARYHLDPEDAVAAALELGRPLVVPVHYGTYRLAFDPINAALPRFAAAAVSAGIDWRWLEPLDAQSFEP